MKAYSEDNSDERTDNAHRHMAEYIKNTVAEVLEQYEISVSQIYTVTSDNGANIL